MHIRARKIYGSSQIVNGNKIQKTIINRHDAGISIGRKQIIRENEQDIIVIIPITKTMKIKINKNIRKNKKNKTDAVKKTREFPSTTYKVKIQPNAPQI